MALRKLLTLRSLAGATVHLVRVRGLTAGNCVRARVTTRGQSTWGGQPSFHPKSAVWCPTSARTWRRGWEPRAGRGSAHMPRFDF